MDGLVGVIANTFHQNPQRKSYMWLYRTGKEAKQQLILYDYQETHEAKHPKAFLNGFKGYRQ